MQVIFITSAKIVVPFVVMSAAIGLTSGSLSAPSAASLIPITISLLFPLAGALIASGRDEERDRLEKASNAYNRMDCYRQEVLDCNRKGLVDCRGKRLLQALFESQQADEFSSARGV